MVNLVSYSRYRRPVQENCPICFDPLATGIVVKHSGGGKRHKIHLECLQQSIKAIGAKCPTCRCDFDVNSLFTWEDKLIKQLKISAKDLSIISLYSLASAIHLSSIIWFFEIGFIETIGLGMLSSAFLNCSFKALARITDYQILSSECGMLASVIVFADKNWWSEGLPSRDELARLSISLGFLGAALGGGLATLTQERN